MGFFLTSEDTKPNLDKNEKLLTQFLRLTGYYRNSIPNYALVVNPSRTLLKNKYNLI